MKERIKAKVDEAGETLYEFSEMNQTNLPAEQLRTSPLATEGGAVAQSIAAHPPAATIPDPPPRGRYGGQDLHFDREAYRREISEQRRQHTKRVRSVLP